MTFDIDWAHDSVLADTMSLVGSAGAAATWFVTHDTPLLSDLRCVDRSELGIHPNFNHLLHANPPTDGDATAVLSRLMDLIPDATTVRSHSTTQSSKLFELFASIGLTHDVNNFIPSGTDLAVKPWRLWNGLVRVPYIWEDDVHCICSHSPQPEREPRDVALDGASDLVVVDFHPIHVYLNTESLDRYERTRPLHQSPDELVTHRFEGYGTRSRLQDLLSLVSPT